MGASPAGYDHNMVLRKGSKFGMAAVVIERESGRAMSVYTDQPGVQLYTGNFLDGTAVGRGETKYAQYHGFCLETQHFPDSPNRKAFPSTVLRPGQVFRSTTEYRFAVVESAHG